MDILFIRDLAIKTIIGVYEWEKRIEQTLLFDLEIAFDNRKASANDTLTDTLDYVCIGDVIKCLLAERHFQLIESVAEYVSHQLIEQFNLEKIRLTVRKSHALPGAKEVGITIERMR